VKTGTFGPVVTLLGVFLLGGIAGAGGAVAYLRHEVREFAAEPRFRDRARVRGLTRMLDLTDAQRDRVKAILEKHASERETAFSDMIQRCGDPVKKQKAEVDAEIRAVLTPEQQPKFDALVKKQDERFLFGPHGHP